MGRAVAAVRPRLLSFFARVFQAVQLTGRGPAVRLFFSRGVAMWDGAESHLKIGTALAFSSPDRVRAKPANDAPRGNPPTQADAELDEKSVAVLCAGWAALVIVAVAIAVAVAIIWNEGLGVWSGGLTTGSLALAFAIVVALCGACAALALQFVRGADTARRPVPHGFTVQFLFGWSSVLIAAGALLATVAIAWRPSYDSYNREWNFSGNDVHWPMLLAAGILALSGVFVGTKGLYLWGTAPEGVKTPREAKAQRRQLFNHHLALIGYGLVLGALVTLVTLAGLHKRGQFIPVLYGPEPGIESSTSGPEATRLLLSMNMAAVGALFFTATQLRKVRDDQRKQTEPFDYSQFWSSLAYRVGEALLFTAVVYLAIWYFGSDATKPPADKSHPPGELAMPLLGLLLGMFVVSGERLVCGIARRVLDAASALIPVREEDLRTDEGTTKDGDVNESSRGSAVRTRRTRQGARERGSKGEGDKRE